MAKIDQKITISAEDKASVAFNNVAKSLQKLTDKFDDSTKEIERTRKKVDSSVISFNHLKNALAGVGFVYTANSLKDLADRFTLLENRIAVSTSSVQQMSDSIDELRNLSNRTGTSLENNAILFQRLGIASKSLGATNKDMLALTETVANLGRISGSSVEDMKNATRQFAQAMSQSNLRAEEFNSVVEQIPALISEVAFEMGYMQGEFGNAVREGKILSKDVYEALLRAQERVNEQAKQLPLTIGQASQTLQNTLIVEVGRLNKELGVTASVAGGLKAISDNFDEIKNTIAALMPVLGGVAGAWLLVATRAKLAAVSAASFSFAINPVVGLLAIFGATLGASAAQSALFRDEISRSAFAVDDLSSAIRNMTIEEATNSIVKMKQSYRETNEEIGNLYNSIIDLESAGDGGVGRVAAKRRQSNKEEIEKIQKEIEALSAQSKGYKRELLEAEDALARLKKFEEKRTARIGAPSEDEAKKAVRQYENLRKELEDQNILAVEKFELNNRIINQQASADAQLMARLKQNNAIQLRDTLARIDAERNAESIKQQEDYDKFIQKITGERELLTAWLEEKKELIQKFEGEESVDSRLGQLQSEYDRRLEIIERNEEAEQALKQRKRDEEIENQAKVFGTHADYMTGMLKLDLKSNEGRKKGAKQTAGYLLNNASQYSKKAFEINKAFQTGQAIVEGYAAVQKALAAFPPPFNFAAAAAVAASTAVQVRGIQSASFGGGSTPSAPSGSTGQASVPTTSTATAPTESFSQNVVIQLEGVDDEAIYSGKTIRKITEEIAKQTENGITNVRFA